MICTKCKKEIAPEHIITIESKEDMCYLCYKLEKKTVCIDFDGVISQYTGWQGPHHMGEPMPGVAEFLQEIWQEYNLVIHTTRDVESVYRWLKYYDLDGFIYQITNKKIPAVVYIDDRALPFQGSFITLSHQIKNFKPHWK